MSTSTPSETNPVVAFAARQWVGILIAVIAIVFIAQNRIETPISLFWARLTAPLWVVLASVFVAGWIAGAVRTRSKAKRKG